MSIFWRGMTTRGAVAGGLTGLFSSVLLVLLSKTVWVAVLGFPAPIFPYDNPALFSMPLAFFATWFFSVTDGSLRASRERGAFDRHLVMSEIGITPG
jgi:cation/acetate symporter